MGFQPSRLIPRNRSIFQCKDSQSSNSWESWYQNLRYVPISLGISEDDSVLTAATTEDSLRNNSMLDLWHSIIAQYTRRRLSESRDRLPAISAIARAFKPCFQCNYYAGLWDRFFVRELAWSFDPGQIGQSFKSTGP